MMSSSTAEDILEIERPAPAPVEEHPRAAPGRPLLPPLTSAARGIFWTLAGLFLLCVALRLNGSSLACTRLSLWQDVLLKDAPSGLLLSEPKMIRSDEWQIWTPAILAQARQTPAFPTTNLSLGPGTTPLLMSIPARHYTMFLRPQLWGYFLLPVEYGFAWNWDFKIFGLLAAMFLLCWTLTDGKLGLSLFGGLSVLFSPLVQWWFSSPSMLPEMLTYWALGVTAALRLLGPLGRSRNRPLATALSVGVLAVSLANMMLCCYPPFEIVLGHLGLFIVVGFAWQHRLWSAGGALLIVGAGALAALLLLPWFLDCYATLQLVAHTVYPGQRQCFGGTLAPVRLFSGFLSLGLTEAATPAALYNVCEAGSFYPLWLLALALGFGALVRVLIRAPASTWTWLTDRGLKVMLAAYLLMFTLFALLPFPPWLCRVTLLTRIIEVRGLAGLGLAGTLLIVLNLGAAPVARASWKVALAVGTAWSLGVLAFLVYEQPLLLCPPTNTVFLTLPRLLGLAGAASGFGFVYLLVPSRWAVVALAAPFILKTALVNPIGIGLPELINSPALQAVRTLVRANPMAQWVFYDSLFGVEALKSAGAPVLNGVRIIPDPALIRILDPTGRDRDAYNRYAHLIFDREHPTPQVSVQLVNKVFCVVEITPAQVRALFPRVCFIATTRASPDLGAAGFRLLRDWPEDHLWIYQLEEERLAPPPAS